MAIGEGKSLVKEYTRRRTENCGPFYCELLTENNRYMNKTKCLNVFLNYGTIFRLTNKFHTDFIQLLTS